MEESAMQEAPTNLRMRLVDWHYENRVSTNDYASGIYLVTVVVKTRSGATQKKSVRFEVIH